MSRGATFWTAAPTRFAGLRHGRARLALVLLALLLASCLTALMVPEPPAPSAAAFGGRPQTDQMLFETIVAGVRGGGNYYEVTADALRAGGYPLRPFLTFRMPALAVTLASLPLDIAPGRLPQGLLPRILLAMLLLGMAWSWAGRLGKALPRTIPRIAAGILGIASLLAFVGSDLIAIHEIWAGPLVAWSLALRRPGRWVEAVALGLAAMLIRETAALYVVIMAIFAWLEGERREAIGWGAALALFAAALGVHAWAVAGVTAPMDIVSPIWGGFQGFGMFVKSVTLSTGLQAIPLAVGSILVGLALFGWASWDDPLALRMFCVLAAYAAAIGLFARLDTAYWGLLVAPVFLLGLAFVPDGIRDLFRQSLDKRRITVTRVTR